MSFVKVRVFCEEVGSCFEGGRGKEESEGACSRVSGSMGGVAELSVFGRQWRGRRNKEHALLPFYKSGDETPSHIVVSSFWRRWQIVLTDC